MTPHSIATELLRFMAGAIVAIAAGTLILAVTIPNPGTMTTPALVAVEANLVTVVLCFALVLRAIVRGWSDRRLLRAITAILLVVYGAGYATLIAGVEVLAWSEFFRTIGPLAFLINVGAVAWLDVAILDRFLADTRRTIDDAAPQIAGPIPAAATPVPRHRRRHRVR